MIRKLSWLLVIAGGIVLSWNIYHWWMERSARTYDLPFVESVVEDWKDTSPRRALNKGIKSHKTLTQGSKIGKLMIPRINGVILAIIHGTDPQSLKGGVGHHIGDGTVKPGETGHVVLAGHNDTSLREMGKIQKGDQLIVEYDGHYFIYQVRKMWITTADDRTVIVPKDRPTLTLTTCHPFNHLGNAPERYIVESELIEMRKRGDNLQGE